MTAYALSLLTNRQFLINITVPCNFSKLFIPNKVNWLLSEYNLNKMSTRKIYCINHRNYSSADCITNKTFILIVNKTFNEDILILSTNLNLIAYFALNFKENILNIGYSIEAFRFENLVHKWYNELFKLEPKMQKKYNQIKTTNLNEKETQLFCAQIRIGGKRENVVSDLQFNNRNVTKLFWNFIKENFIKSSTTLEQNWKLFVTSDIEEAELEAVEEFGNDKVIRIKGLNTHVGRESKLGNNCSRIEKPILDFHFLQNCDKAVVSKGSYFGLIGLYNRKKGNKDIHFIGSRPSGAWYKRPKKK